jgi:hypothetical protein
MFSVRSPDFSRREPAYSGSDAFAARLGPLAIAAILFLLNGCALHIGQKTVVRDRFDYSGAIARSWKEQMLLNVVKVRYAEPPIFLDVAQVVTSYTFEGTGTIGSPDWDGVNSAAAASITGRWAESPTITYTPLTGEKFIKSLMQPVPPVSLLSLVQSGWPIDVVFSVGVRSINGLNALSNATLMQNAGDPDFYRLLTLLRDAQASGTVGLRVTQKEDETGAAILFHSRTQTEADVARTHEIRRLLRLDPDANEFKIKFGSEPANNKELAFLTRSMLEMLVEASKGVKIPDADLNEGRASKPLAAAKSVEGFAHFAVHVESSREKPPAVESFVSVRYRNRWFWLPDRDIESKRSLGFLMVLFELASSGTTAAPPVLTITKP